MYKTHRKEWDKLSTSAGDRRISEPPTNVSHVLNLAKVFRKKPRENPIRSTGKGEQFVDRVSKLGRTLDHRSTL